jgi:hypothetical protein
MLQQCHQLLQVTLLQQLLLLLAIVQLRMLLLLQLNRQRGFSQDQTWQ